jgi:DNA-binding FadR family transcriptional regulator
MATTAVMEVLPPAPLASGSAGTGKRARKLAEVTAEKIEMKIIEMGWPVGEVLGSETELLDEYEVSRAALRESIRLLEHHNIAYMRRGPGGGLVVAEPDPEAVARAAAVFLRFRKMTAGDLYETRIALEYAAVRAAAENIDEAGVAKLRAALDHEAGFVGGESDATIHDFHIVVAELSGNPALHLFSDVLVQLSAASFLGTSAMFDKEGTRSVSRASQVEEVHRVHSAIAEASIAGDASLAQHRMQRHLNAMAAALE